MPFHEIAWAPRGKAVVDDDDVTVESRCDDCAPIKGQRDGARICIGVGHVDPETSGVDAEGVICAGCGAVLVPAECEDCWQRDCARECLP